MLFAFFGMVRSREIIMMSKLIDGQSASLEEQSTVCPNLICYMKTNLENIDATLVDH
jgi:hypothetical protein